MARLKVFTTQLGFYDVAIAVPSQKAALDAWGAKQNLFDAGLASVATHGQVVDAALSKPGVLFRRPLGSAKPYTEATEDHADLPDLGKAKPAKPRLKGPPKLSIVSSGPTPEERRAEEKRAAEERAEAARQEKAAREALRRAEQAEREATRRREQAEREMARRAEEARRKAAERTAQEELRRAEAEHAATLREIASDIEALKRREQEEKKAFAARKRALLAQAKGD